MFRLTQFMRQLHTPQPSRGERFSGPVVVWNLIRRCNLSCMHCYSASADREYRGELDTATVLRVLGELREGGVPALILSGGEPLLREDLFEIAHAAKGHGFYLALSTNGLLLDQAMAQRVAMVGFDYVGISLDGLAANHDRIRGRQGAFEGSLAGIRRCLDLGVKAGIRMTLTGENSSDLPGLLELMEVEGIHRLYLSHLNYAGRGKVNRKESPEHQITRQAMERLLATAWQDVCEKKPREIVTGNNDADGPFFLRWVAQQQPQHLPRMTALLQRWGGNASGVGIANIDNLGQLHPDIFWWNHSLGEVHKTPFTTLWQQSEDPLLQGLRQRPRPVKGRCATCRHLDICGGNTRVRAMQVFNDPWAEDPGCYLTDEEINEEW
ncbi:MAG: heme d1 biosynthesis radical SAM protein NirJ [Magnetococcales bacterium]|nr:heme d1 biosynthesis radical SAM protein NirJ [Magnetococcales bacterium]NGZ25299.1 heme d1 biosynthesis radical SAM protein NirJ [Magnetococcales bacterium]